MSAGCYAFITCCIVWLAFELWLNIRDRERVDASGNKNSGVQLFFALVLALASCLIIRQTHATKISWDESSGYLFGAGVLLSGAVLRWWSVWSLGTHFRTVLSVQEGQKLVRSGPYKFIRHPSYAGVILVLLGFGIGLGTWAGLAAITAIILPAYIRRIKQEERLMIECFPEEYPVFMGKTWKLIPFVY